MELAYFSPINWDFIWQRPQSLALELARMGHKVLFVEPVRPLAKQVYFKQRVGVRQVDDGITTVGFIPQALGEMGPVRLWETEDAISRFHTTRALRTMLSPEAVLVVGAPNWGDRVDWGRLPHRVFCYDCMDFVEGMFSGKKAEAIHRKESELIARSDVVFATHPALAKLAESQGRSAHLLPNGVSFEMFVDAAPPTANWVRKLPRPIVGYVGAVAKWTDLALIRAAAELHPAWSFVVIGPTLSKTSRTALLGPRNIHRLGQRSHDEIASFISLFDVCIAPFKAGSVADHTDPLKVYEYLACGKPVVASNVPSLNKLNGLVYSVSGREEFMNSLEAAAAETDPGLAETRKDFARQQSWSKRAETLVDIVNEAANGRKPECRAAADGAV